MRLGDKQINHQDFFKIYTIIILKKIYIYKYLNFIISAYIFINVYSASLSLK